MCPVDHTTARASGLCCSRQQLAPKAGALRAIGTGNHDVTWLERIHRFDLELVWLGGPLVDIRCQHGVGATDDAHVIVERSKVCRHRLVEKSERIEDVRDDRDIELVAQDIQQRILFDMCGFAHGVTFPGVQQFGSRSINHK